MPSPLTSYKHTRRNTMANMHKISTRDKVRGIIIPEPNYDELAWGAEPAGAAYGAISEFDADGELVSVTIPEERFVPFAKPGLRVEQHQLYTVKAMGPAGNLTQLPMEKQINNHVASPDDYVGIKYYERKGFVIFFDYAKARGVFCPTKNCWAEWNDKNAGFCHPVHQKITKPDQGPGRFGADATTTASQYQL